MKSTFVFGLVLVVVIVLVNFHHSSATPMFREQGDLDLFMLEDALNDPDVYSAGWLSRAFNKVKGAVQKGCQYVNGKSLRELNDRAFMRLSEDNDRDIDEEFLSTALSALKKGCSIVG